MLSDSIKLESSNSNDEQSEEEELNEIISVDDDGSELVSVDLNDLERQDEGDAEGSDNEQPQGASSVSFKYDVQEQSTSFHREASISMYQHCSFQIW